MSKQSKPSLQSGTDTRTTATTISAAPAIPTQPATTQPIATAQQPATTGRTVTHEQIAKRAYELWQSRGGAHGSHDQDWQQAERELKLGKQ